MHFEIKFPASRIANCALIYRAEEFSFDVVPSLSSFTSVLVNDLNLDINESGLALSVWGLCPYTSWKITNLVAPKVDFGDVVLATKKPLHAGISLRMHQGLYWPVLVDPSSGWVVLASGNEAFSRAKILSGVILETDRHHRLCNVWLRPDKLPERLVARSAN